MEKSAGMAFMAISILAASAASAAGREKMPGEAMPSMPLAAESSEQVVTNGDDVAAQAGFGAGEEKARMRTLMMVEGEQPAPLAADSCPYRLRERLSPANPAVGRARLEIRVDDATSAARGVSGLAFRATLGMIGMSMGGSEPEVRDAGNGVYTTELDFAMPGGWRLQLRSPGCSKNFSFDVGQ